MEVHPGAFNGKLFNVIVDSVIAGVRERALNGNLDSMVVLGTYIQKGTATGKNPALALAIFDHVISRKTEIPSPDTYWRAICQKCHIHAERGEDEAVDALSLELVRHMAQFPPEQWDHDKMASAVEWLRDRHSNSQNLFG